MYRQTSSPRIQRAFDNAALPESRELTIFPPSQRANEHCEDVRIPMENLSQETTNNSYTTIGINNAHLNSAFEMDMEIPGKSFTNSEENKHKLSDDNHNKSSNLISLAEEKLKTLLKIHSRRLQTFVRVCLLLLYNIYLGFAIYLTWFDTSWCDGVRLLVVVTAIAYSIAAYKIVIKPYVMMPLKSLRLCQTRKHKYVGKIMWCAVWVSVIIFLVIDSKDNRYRLVSAAGLLVLLFLGYIFSVHRNQICWQQVQWGILLQFVFGLAILRWDVGKQTFECLGEIVKTFLQFSDEGSTFVFGYLVSGELKDAPTQPGIFAFKILSAVIYFSFFTSILFYYGWMQAVVENVGWCFQKTIGTTACESINAAANIFLGMTDTPLVIRPYLSTLTKSELHAVLTGGFATIAGSLLAAYISFGVNASHLLSASAMSAPAALAFAKLVYPETESSNTRPENIKTVKSSERNALEAATNGASAAITIVANIAANLIAFVAFVALMNSVLAWFGSLINWDFLSFEWLLSKLFVPLSLIMGVDWEDKEKVAGLVGLKTVINEFVAYGKLSEYIKEKSLTARSEAIATFALCGFSNIGSIGIQLGVLGAMAPERKSDLASMALRAMIAGSAACFMTACVAGTLLTDGS